MALTSHATDLKLTNAVPPRGSRVADDDLLRQVVAALQRAIDVPEHVTAAVEHGVIELFGDVQWQHEREAAARTVRHLSAGNVVHNLIDVRPTARAVDLNSAIRAAMVRSTGLEGHDIQVTTDRRGHVALNGTVSSWADREQAEQVCWAAPGISEVRNELRLLF